MDRRRDIRDRIQGVVNDMLLEESEHRIFVVSDERLLSDTEFDSLAFAVFFARLDEEFGVDPFQETALSEFPRTFEDLSILYGQHLVEQPLR